MRPTYTTPRGEPCVIVAIDVLPTTDGPKTHAVVRSPEVSINGIPTVSALWQGGNPHRYAYYEPHELTPQCDIAPCPDYAEFGALICPKCSRREPNPVDAAIDRANAGIRISAEIMEQVRTRQGGTTGVGRGGL